MSRRRVVRAVRAAFARAREVALVTEPFPDLAFGERLARTGPDLTLRPVEVAAARLTRRNPPPPRWRRRRTADWITIGSSGGPADRPQSGTPLLAAVAAWNEEDIIFATVENLRQQGAQEVFVIDDDSDDDTIGEAQAAGASVVRRRSDGIYSEAVRASTIQDLVARESEVTGGEAWWILADADEMPRGPSGRTIVELVADLPGWVDVVGSRVLDHVPHRGSRLALRAQPVLAFPLARRYCNPYCPSGHWKHQLIRVRRPGDVVPLPGHHVVRTDDGRRIREPVESLLMHHFPLRNLERTAARFRAAGAPEGRYARSPDPFSRARLQQRTHELKACHAGEFHLVLDPFPGRPRVPADIRHWHEFVPADEQRWPWERRGGQGGDLRLSS